jgi:hypothetical protein
MKVTNLLEFEFVTSTSEDIARVDKILNKL